MQPSTRVVADRYLLLERIGEGGRAVVHRAHDQLLDRDVAIKLIRPEYAEDRDFVDRFGSEARNAAALHDPRIVTIFDSGIDAATGVDYIVMQLIHGQTLEKVLRERGRLPLADAVRIAAEAARALQIAHDRGLVHGSVKPGNILLDDNGGVRVGDFGIARAAGDGGASGSGVEIGSPEYVSPEQVNGEPATSASDLYSLGLVLDEMLTGKRPFGGPSPAAIAQQRLRLEPPPPSSIQHDVPRELDAIVARATQRNPRRRYASAAELAAALAEFQRAHLGDLTAPLGGGRTNPATAAPGVAAIAGVAGLAGGATAGMSMRAGTATERTRSWTMPGTASGTSGGAAVAASPAGSVLPGFRTGPVDDAPESLERRRHFAPPAILLPIVAIALVVLAAGLVLSGVGEPPGSSAQPPVSSAVAAVQPSNGPGEPSNGGVPASSPVSSSSFTGSAASPVAAPSGDPPSQAASPSAASLRAGQTARPTPAATGRAAAAPTLRATPAPTPRPTPRPTPAPVVAPTPSPPSPGATVSTFYTLVAQHRFDEAAALWSPRMLEQYPPKRFINHRFAATTAIDVLRLDVTSESISQGTATVAVDLIEHRSDGSTRHWVGSWDLVLTSSGWLMDQSHF